MTTLLIGSVSLVSFWTNGANKWTVGTHGDLVAAPFFSSPKEKRLPPAYGYDTLPCSLVHYSTDRLRYQEHTTWANIKQTVSSSRKISDRLADLRQLSCALEAFHFVA
jgi:hypothetical protein